MNLWKYSISKILSLFLPCLFTCFCESSHRWREMSDKRDNKAHHASYTKDKGHTTGITSTKPRTNECDSSTGCHKGNRDVLCYRSRKKGGEWAGSGFNTLSKPDDSSLSIVGNHFLHYGLFWCFYNRHQHHPDNDWYEKKYDGIWYRKKETNNPTDSIESGKSVDGIFSDSFFCDDESSDDKGKRDKSPQDSPSLDWYYRESVWIHECHKYTSEEIIKCRKRYQPHISRDRADEYKCSSEVHLHGLFFFCLSCFFFWTRDSREVYEGDDSQSDARNEYPFHPEKSYDETRRNRCHCKGETINGSYFSIGLFTFFSYKEKSDQCCHGDISHITDDAPYHEYQDESPETEWSNVRPCAIVGEIDESGEYIENERHETRNNHDVFLCMMVDKSSKKESRKHICYCKNTSNPRCDEDWSRLQKGPVGQSKPDKGIRGTSDKIIP